MVVELVYKSYKYSSSQFLISDSNSKVCQHPMVDRVIESIVATIVVGGSCVKNSKRLSVYLGRVELGKHFNDTQHL